ncbi:hypothetical protein BGX26_003228 [Mortierella sp. AD094]|nr:hypothetical protein BGX26_003228 [Mortierella sp. AD094]
MSHFSSSLPALPYSNNLQQYQSPFIDYSMTFYELSLCDDPLETESWNQSTDWNYIQSFGVFPHYEESISPFITFDSEIEDDIPQNYSNLWEIQLELGEIPDMISNNILKPCPLSSYNRHAPQNMQLCNHAEMASLEHEMEDEAEEELEKRDDDDENKEEEEEEVEEEGDYEEGEEGMVWPSEVSIESEPPVQSERLLRTMFFFACKSSPSTGVYQEQEYGDGDESEGEEDEDEDEEDNKWDVAVNHPVYGMLSSSLELKGGEFRHDRKDSGVFMHGDRDGYMDERPSPLGDDIQVFPVAVEHRDRDVSKAKHGISAAYKSLQRIASSFSSLSSSSL